MNRLALACLLAAVGSTSALAQYYPSRERPYYERPRYEGRNFGCDREKRAAERHYYTALRNQGNKGYLDGGEQRVQQQLQARYDACRTGYGRRGY